MSIIIKRQSEFLAEAFQNIDEPMVRAQIFDLTMTLASLTRTTTIFGHLLADLEGRILSVDDGYCDIVGRERPLLLSTGLRELTHPDDLGRGDFLVRRLIAQDEPFVIVKRYLREDRSPVWVENHVALMKDGAGPDRLVLSGMPVEAPGWALSAPRDSKTDADLFRQPSPGSSRR